jgi:hypothetical protein
MKMTSCKIAFAIASVFLLHLDLNAQVKISVLAGANLSWQQITNKEVGSVRVYYSLAEGGRSKPLPGYFVGTQVNVTVDSATIFRTGITFATMGQIEEIDVDDGSSFRYVDRINYFEIPMMFSFYLSRNRKQQQGTYFNLGLYVSKGVGGNTKYENPALSHNRSGDIVFASEVNNKTDYADYDLPIKPGDFGLKMGWGFRKNNIIFELNYSLGMKNIHPEILNPRPNSLDDLSNERKKRNRSISFTMGFVIGDGNK